MKNVSGSALLMVVLILSVVMILMVSLSKSVLLCTQSAHARITYEQQLRMTKGLLEYAIEVCRLNQSNLQTVGGQDKKITLNVEQLPHSWRAVITIDVQDPISIIAQLTSDNQKLCEIECKLSMNEKKYTVSDWHVH